MTTSPVTTSPVTASPVTASPVTIAARETGVPPTFRLSGLELHTCWETLRLGPPPTSLRLFSPAATQAERAAKQARARAALAARGLFDGPLPRPDLAAALRLFARPERWLDLRRATGPERMSVAVGATAGPSGIVLRTTTGTSTTTGGDTDGDRFDLIAIDAAYVAAILLEPLASLEPGIGTPVNLPADLLDRARAEAPPQDLWALADRLRAHGLPRAEASALVRMTTGVRSGGQLGATARAAHGERRAPWVVGFHTTEHGLFSQVRRPESGGRATVSIAPSDVPRLRRLWSELADQCPPT